MSLELKTTIIKERILMSLFQFEVAQSKLTYRSGFNGAPADRDSKDIFVNEKMSLTELHGYMQKEGFDQVLKNNSQSNPKILRKTYSGTGQKEVSLFMVKKIMTSDGEVLDSETTKKIWDLEVAKHLTNIKSKSIEKINQSDSENPLLFKKVSVKDLALVVSNIEQFIQTIEEREEVYESSDTDLYSETEPLFHEIMIEFTDNYGVNVNIGSNHIESIINKIKKEMEDVQAQVTYEFNASEEVYDDENHEGVDIEETMEYISELKTDLKKEIQSLLSLEQTCHAEETSLAA